MKIALRHLHPALIPLLYRSLLVARKPCTKWRDPGIIFPGRHGRPRLQALLPGENCAHGNLPTFDFDYSRVSRNTVPAPLLDSMTHKARSLRDRPDPDDPVCLVPARIENLAIANSGHNIFRKLCVLSWGLILYHGRNAADKSASKSAIRIHRALP